MIDVYNHFNNIDDLMVIIIGKIIMISISKIKNKTLMIKKWIENGIRENDIGLNPHSNGDIFCLSVIDFFFSIIIIVDTVIVNIVVVMVNISTILIIHFRFNP